MEPQVPEIKDLLPLRTSDFHVLLALMDGPLHGYAITKAVETGSAGRVRIELGSLYRQVARLLRTALIEEADGRADEPHAGKARRSYQLTKLGRAAVREEVSRLRDTLASAEAKLAANP